MRRRDKHFLFALVGVLILHIASTAVSLFVIYSQRARLRRFCGDVTQSVKACEKASVEACSTVLALSELGLAEPGDSAPVQTRILGFGQSKSKTASWLYADIEADGVVHREYIQRIPFSQLRESGASFSQN